DIQKSSDSITAKELKIDASNLSSGNSLRDSHAKEKINASKYPQIVLSNVIGSNGKATGVLMLNGVSKDVMIDFNEDAGNVSASFKINLNDFNISDISYMGVGVVDTVEIDVTLPITVQDKK